MFSGSRRSRGRARQTGRQAGGQGRRETESTVKAQTDVTIPSGWRTTKVRCSHSPTPSEWVKRTLSRGINGKLIAAAATAIDSDSSHRNAFQIIFAALNKSSVLLSMKFSSIMNPLQQPRRGREGGTQREGGKCHRGSLSVGGGGE